MHTIMPAQTPPRHLHFLLPFALPSAADAASSPHNLASSPALAALLTRARLVERSAGEDFQRTLPHARWLAARFGANQGDGDDNAPLAPYMLLADGGTPGDAPWACVEPVHVQIATDHLVLIDPSALELPAAEAAVLLEVARPLVEELGVQLQAPDPRRWYLSSEGLAALAGAAPLRASGRNIEIWLPHEARTGERSRLWMKLQNEVQMVWFGHAVNETREARGQFTANSIWFHGQGRLRPVSSPFARVLSTNCATRGLGLAAQVPVDAPPAAFAALAGEDEVARATLLELDALTVPFIQQDWAAWRAALDTLERNWFAPALEVLRAGELRELSVTLCGDIGATTLAVRRGDLRKFWRCRALTSLFE
ncbi:MAG: regulator [Burkholderia sp.]